MEEKKITVKELATELNVPHTEMLRGIKKNLNIAAKSSNSILTDEEIGAIRAHYKNENSSSNSVAGSGVIVRRRTTIAEEPKKKESKKSTQKQENNKEVKKIEKVVKADKETKEEKPKTNDKDEKQASSKKNTKTQSEEKPAKVIKKEEKSAKIVKPAEKQEKEVVISKENETKKTNIENKNEDITINTDKDKDADAKKKSATISATPDGNSTSSILPPVGDVVEETKNASQVRVISMPNPNERSENQENRQRNDRDNRDSRDNKDRDFRNRPNNNNQRFDNNRQGQQRRAPQDKDGQSADKDRPRNNTQSFNRAPRPLEVVPFPTEEQSRKKRNNKSRNNYSNNSGEGQHVASHQDFKVSKYSFDMDDDMPRRRRKGKKKEKQVVVTTAPMKAAKRKIRIEEAIRVADMAHQMGLKSSEIIKVLFGLGVMATINSALDYDTASVVASEFEYEVEKVGFSAEDAVLPVAVDLPEQLKTRPPVITIMGHVDHGKTSLLDAIRETNVTDGEAGGITQHIGAYHVRTKRGEIVFLDTPGHEAFTAMRLRGAQVTDIVVLVVAADDGVMEQTREAINHAKAAEVPIIVAVNKMDKEGANPDRVLRELAELGLQSEDWGGDTVTTMLSAKKRQGIDELLELLILQSEIMDLKANPDKSARGHIVEAKLDKGRGPVATVLIQEGTLNQGDAFVCGVFAGRVRALFNDQGKKITTAGPSMPVEVQGFDGVPEAGEEFVALQDEKLARRIADSRLTKQREKALAKEARVTLETFLARNPDAEEAQTLNLVLKADVQGSLEAITESLKKLSTAKVRINIIHGGAGAISESDIMLAAASEAIIIGFNVRPTAKVKEVADNEHVDIRFYDIIYKLSEEIQQAMTGLLAPVQKEVYLGQAEVRQLFSLSRVGTIAGSYVVDGKITRNAGVRLLRDGVVIYTGKISSLKRLKEDAKEVLKGFEFGISLENYNDIKVGDVIEAFEMQEEAAKL